MSKVLSAKEAAALVQDGDTLAVQGIVCTSIPQYLVNHLRDRYLESGHPKNITLRAAPTPWPWTGSSGSSSAPTWAPPPRWPP